MIIKISRSGGFAGINENLGTINTDSLSGEAAIRVENSITNITHLLDEMDDYPPVGADMYRYEIEILNQQGEHQQLALVDEGGAKSVLMKSLQDLLDFL